MKHLAWHRAVDVKPLLFATVAVVALGGVVRPAAADVVMQEFASPAPNVFGSPSFAGWATNAINALENGLSSVGNPATNPAAYFRVTKGTDTSNIVTGFPSWQGLANPGVPFAAELGNRLQFGLLVNGNGTPVSLSELSFDMHSSDQGNILGFTGNFTAGDVYNANRVGINFGGNGVLGGGDDTFVTSGSASQLVNAFAYVGVGNALSTGDASCPATGTNQQQIDCVKAAYDSIMPFGLTTDYTLTAGATVLASSTATVQFVPEPASLLLLGSALVVLGVGRRRRAR